MASQSLISTVNVAPLVGAWIEITLNLTLKFWPVVAPLVGAWIEITIVGGAPSDDMSLLSWERGLKSYF